MKAHTPVVSPAPSPLAHAVCVGLSGRAPAPGLVSGFSLLEVLLVMGGVSLLSAGSFVVYQSSSNSSNVKTEQDNVQRLASNADRVYGALGSYQGVSTTRAVSDRVPPQSMVVGTGLMSKWSQPVVVEPSAVGAKANAGLKITYQAVPARACLKFAQAASEGMFDVLVGNHSVLGGGRFQTNSAIVECGRAPSVPVVFIYHGGTTGLAGTVLPPVSLPPVSPPSTPPPVAPPPAPPPSTPPTTPPPPVCGAAPAAAATGTTPAGQTCSFIWNSVAAPTCWSPLALCTPSIAPPPTAPPPAAPPVAPPPSTPPPGSPMCVVPAPATRLCATAACVDGTDGSVDTVNNGTYSCPAGQLITTPGAYLYAASAPRTRTQTVTRNETASCPDPFGAVRWSASTFNPATFGTWNQTFTCAPACVAPANTTGTQPGALGSQAGTPNTAPGVPESQTLACPAGQAGSITQSRTRTITQATTQSRTTTQSRSVTYTCPLPVGAFTTAYGAWSAPGAPYGAWSAPTASGGWSAPQAPYGAWATTSNTCTPTQEVCSDGSPQVAAWFSADYDQIPLAPSVPVVRYGDSTVQLTAEEKQRFEYLQNYNPVTHTESYPGGAGNPADWNDSSSYNESCDQLTDVGNVNYDYNMTFQCVSNMGMHYCDYNDLTGGWWFEVCRRSCASQLIGKSNNPYTWNWPSTGIDYNGTVCTGQPGCNVNIGFGSQAGLPACNQSNVGQALPYKWYRHYFSPDRYVAIDLTLICGGPSGSAQSSCNVPAGTAFNWAMPNPATPGTMADCTATTGSAQTISPGASLSINDTASATTGTAAFKCNNGTISHVQDGGAVCAVTNASACPIAAGRLYSWSVSGRFCQAAAPANTSVPSGGTILVHDTNQGNTNVGLSPRQGQATFSCYNGQISGLPTGATCN